MTSPEKNIVITVTCEGTVYTIQTYPNEYRNLMMLIYDKIYVEEFGDCLGMGKCATCLIEIVEAPFQFSSYNRNEETTISKAGLNKENVRLSCQILIDEHINGLKLNVIR